MTAVDTLLEISSDALHSGTVQGEAENPLAQQHLELLAQRNGFFAFESALLVRPIGGPLDVLAWNSPQGWRSEYGDSTSGLFFFAEDIFGGQFAVDSDRVVTFDPETGEREFIASSIETWSRAILDDFDYLTGHTVAHEWQLNHSSIPSGMRLLPRVPLVADGEFTADNMALISDEQRMRCGAKLAATISQMDDGSSFRLPYSIP